jgi:hypothetical protein
MWIIDLVSPPSTSGGTAGTRPHKLLVYHVTVLRSDLILETSLHSVRKSRAQALHDRQDDHSLLETKTALGKFWFWDDKEPSMVLEFRIMEYFRVNGHKGPLREILYHLLPRRLFRL